MKKVFMLTVICSVVLLSFSTGLFAQCCGDCSPIGKTTKVEKVKKMIEKKIEKKAIPEVSKKVIELCIKCGEVKGTKNCCSKKVAKCSKCGLHKGSMGCCKIGKKMKKAIICAKCGEFKGTKNCCSKTAVKCSKCGLHKGAPACCKVKSDKLASKRPLCKKPPYKPLFKCTSCNKLGKKCPKCIAMKMKKKVAPAACSSGCSH